MKETPIEAIKKLIPEGKVSPDSFASEAVRVLHELADLTHQKNGKKPSFKIPVVTRVFEQAIKDVQVLTKDQEKHWQSLLESAKKLMPENSWKTKLLESIEKKISQK